VGLGLVISLLFKPSTILVNILQLIEFNAD